MKLPAVRGLIRRRILVSFRVDPDVMARQLPPPFRPLCVADAAIAGLCLIRLEEMRPRGLPPSMGFHSENAAHRIAVRWIDECEQAREGVYIPLRHTDSWLNRLAGGRVFPGEPRLARFAVREEDSVIDFSMDAADGAETIALRARPAGSLPAGSVFSSLEEASAFFQRGALGYSARGDGRGLDGISLATEVWHVEPLAVETVISSYFADEARFPRGSVALDSALLMRNIPHEWRNEAALVSPATLSKFTDMAPAPSGRA
jgi:Uncharacterized conserved protein (COG2071)